MRRLVTLALTICSLAAGAAGGVACGTGVVVVPADAAGEAGDLPELDFAPPPEVPDTAADLQDEAETQATCGSVLASWQCVRDQGQGCAPWAECYGEGSCEDPPCWGLCEDYPGECRPRTRDAPCSSDADCEEGEACASRAPGARGLCRAKPFAAACWLDDHCPAGQSCAGEVVCPLGAWCAGAEHPGQCMPPASAGTCRDDGDCGAGSYCDGATLCGGAGGCTDTPGVCKVGERPGCMTGADCPKERPWCAGAFTCPEGAQCTTPARPGYCVPPPMSDGCWEDQDCSAGAPICRAVQLCPPGTLCHAVIHRGFCSELPPEGESGLTLAAPAKAKSGTGLHVPVVNRGAVAVFVDPCFGVLLQLWDGIGGKWQDLVPVPLPGANCPQDGGQAARIPPGNGFVAFVTPEFTGRWRVTVVHQMLCKQGLAVPSCVASGLEASSAEIQVD